MTWNFGQSIFRVNRIKTIYPRDDVITVKDFFNQNDSPISENNRNIVTSQPHAHNRQM